jgi:hypothetical protein
MPISAVRVSVSALFHGGKAMANDTRTARAPRGSRWTLIGWGAAVLLLALPFILNAPWSLGDYVFVSVVLLAVLVPIEIAFRSSDSWSYRGAVLLALAGSMMIVWANGAVGIVGSEDNPANLIFYVPLAIGLASSFVVGFKAEGMARAMVATAVSLAIAFALAQTAQRDEPWVSPMLELVGTSMFGLLFLGSAALFRRAARR